MAASDYQITSPNPDKHLLPIARLSADVFSEGKYVDQFSQNYIGNSHYDWDTSRIVLDGDRLIHHWGVWGYLMRVESVELKVGGVGAVVTHPDYRKQGWMHRAARSSFDAMLQAGYDLSVLRGRHYSRIGYARAWNYVTYRIKLEDLPGLPSARPYRPLGAEEVGQMDVLYNRAHAGYTGTAVRPTYRNRYPGDIGVYAWFDEGGKLEGYIRALPDEDDLKALLCLEAAGDPLQGLAALGEIFKGGSYERLACFGLPHDHPMLQRLRKGACIVEDRYFDLGGWRVKVINLKSTLQKLAPLFEERLAGSPYAAWQGDLLLDGGEQKATLYINRGKVQLMDPVSSENVLHAGANLGRFLIGSDEPAEIIRQGDIECCGFAGSLARVLFPNLHPMLSQWDEI